MRRILSPAIFILNRMGYTRKFSLLWLISLIAIGVVVYGLFVNINRIIQPSQRRMEGLVMIEPITRTIQALQLHRGLSATLLSGNETMSSVLAAQEKEITDTFRNLEESLPAKLTKNESYIHIRTDWARLQKEGLRWSAGENLNQHTHLIEHIQLFEQRIADEHLLAIDMDVATYYLTDIATSRLVDVLEHLGRLRASSMSILTLKQQLTENQRVELKVMIAELNDALRHLNLGIASAGHHNPQIHDVLLSVYRDIDNSTMLVTNLVTENILSGRFATPAAAFLGTVTVQIDQSYARLYDTLLPMTKRLTQAHIDRAKHELYVSISISLLAFLLVVYLSVSIYYTIVGNIESITRAARTFASGNLDVRIKLDTHDELSQIGDSFNQMAEDLKTMIGMHREDEERLRISFDTAMDAMVRMDARGNIIGWNRQAEHVFGWTRKEVVGRMLHETIIPLQYREAHLRGLEHFLFSGEGPILNSRIELLGLHRDGHEFPIELSATAVNMSGNYEFNGFIRDITKQKESEELIWNQANFDTLTGLPNRHMFHDRLIQDLKKAHRAGLKTALLFIDLDKFKEVNDTLGHSMGDILLQEAARRIGGCVRETDTVARLGGDEFTVILPELDDTGSVDRIAENILQTLAKPFHLGDEIAYISASIGITLHPVDATEAEDMLKNADQAMYAAKNEGRNRFSYFTQSMQQVAQVRLRLANELRSALAASQFRVHYQPIMNLVTGRIEKVEALVRWQHPEHGMISPAEFIPLAEETGLIIEIGDWVFKEAMRQLKHWRSIYDTDLQISVNVSPSQFGKHTGGSWYKAWIGYLQELELPGQGMVIEITEGLLLDADPNVTDKLLRLRDAGIQVAIDDFGTGYSSLSYLKKFDIDYLKIDRSFVRDLVTNPDDMALSEAIIVMTHKLGLKVIAEGVETEAQRKLLAEAGCDYAQGYLFSKPVSAEEFEELLKGQPPESRHHEI